MVIVRNVYSGTISGSMDIVLKLVIYVNNGITKQDNVQTVTKVIN